MLESMPEGHPDIGPVDTEYGRIIGCSQCPVLFQGPYLEIFHTDAISIDSDSLWKWLGEGFEESIQLLRFLCEEGFSEVFDESIIDFGFVFFHFSGLYIIRIFDFIDLVTILTSILFCNLFCVTLLKILQYDDFRSEYVGEIIDRPR